MNRIKYILYILLLAVAYGCTDKAEFFDPDCEIKAGDEVLFSAHVPQVVTRSAKDDYENMISRFERVSDDYVFNIEMFEEGKVAMVGSATYNPIKNTVGNVTTYDEYGTLTEGSSKFLYWPSNVKKYGFHAVSSNSSPTVENDQSTFEKYLKQDRIEGYGYVPGWDTNLNDGEGAPIRDLDNYNYLTAKEWYAANKAWGAPDGMSSAQLVEYWKKIPLFMRHKRSRITVLLKAGEGVEREQIKYDPVLNKENISMEVYSYDGENNQTVINPLLGSYVCQYEATTLLPAEDVTTACYDAIVNPHDYTEGSNMTEQKVLAVNLSGMKFSFYAANDKYFSSSPGAANEDVKARYNLTEGKHLILEVTLSTDTRKILITAYVVDWEDWPFSSICDDFGQAADPMPINDKYDLIEFLTSQDMNKPGNVGVIMPLDFNLNEVVTGAMVNEKNLISDSHGRKPKDPGYETTYKPGYTAKSPSEIVYPAGWNPTGYDLKATLKLAGATITTNQCLFDKISPSGSIINGTVVIKDQTASDADFECAITKANYGMVDHITVLPGETTRRATRAGMVTMNYGTIYACASQMPVYHPDESTEVLIGGIAAEMLYPTNTDGTADTSTLPTIDQCNVNARVDGGTNVKGGGIAGKAEGKLTNNTYEYGITLSQEVERFKNILYAKGSQDLTINDNEWSTRADNSVVNMSGNLTNVRPEIERYNQVLDSQAELRTLITNGTYNNMSSRFRIANSFTVDDSWDQGIQNLATSALGNLLCELNCNDKTITLTGETNAKMLFSNIQSHLYDLTLVVEKPIVALPDKDATTDEGRLPARAPLAYSVVGDRAVISNVKVKMKDGAYVKSAASAGLVVWAYDGATIEDCQSNMDVRIALPEGTGEQQIYFVGGLVNSAAKATILRCTYLRDTMSAEDNANATPGSNIYYGGIVGGTNTKGIYSPLINITDCTSWLTWSASDALPHAAWGGIIGYSKYQNASSDLVNATNGNCQGNWWAAPAGASAQGWASGMNEEKVIGKKNSVQPLRDTNY